MSEKEEGHKAEVRERIHEDAKKHEANDRAKAEYRHQRDKAYHEMKEAKQPIEDEITAKERGLRREQHETDAAIKEAVNSEWRDEGLNPDD